MGDDLMPREFKCSKCGVDVVTFLITGDKYECKDCGTFQEVPADARNSTNITTEDLHTHFQRDRFGVNKEDTKAKSAKEQHGSEQTTGCPSILRNTSTYFMVLYSIIIIWAVGDGRPSSELGIPNGAFVVNLALTFFVIYKLRKGKLWAWIYMTIILSGFVIAAFYRFMTGKYIPGPGGIFVLLVELCLYTPLLYAMFTYRSRKYCHVHYLLDSFSGRGSVQTQRKREEARPQQVKQIKAIVAKHIEVLRRKQTESVVIDEDYGVKDTTVWESEKENFFNKVIVSEFRNSTLHITIQEVSEMIDELI